MSGTNNNSGPPVFRTGAAQNPPVTITQPAAHSTPAPVVPAPITPPAGPPVDPDPDGKRSKRGCFVLAGLGAIIAAVALWHMSTGDPEKVVDPKVTEETGRLEEFANNVSLDDDLRILNTYVSLTDCHKNAVAGIVQGNETPAICPRQDIEDQGKLDGHYIRIHDTNPVGPGVSMEHTVTIYPLTDHNLNVMRPDAMAIAFNQFSEDKVRQFAKDHPGQCGVLHVVRTASHAMSLEYKYSETGKKTEVASGVNTTVALACYNGGKFNIVRR